MSEIASAYVALLPSGRGFGRNMESEVGGQVKSTGKRLGATFGKLFFAAAGGLAVADFFKGALSEARDAQKVSALTAQVIKSTGGAANVTAKQVDRLASAISRKTGIDDEQIASAENLMLTFKLVRNETGKNNDVFNQATKASVDMAAAMAAASGGQIDFRSSVTLVGKALNDPIKGLSALSRVGVTFTAGQKEQIKQLVETGKTMDAQKLILGELKSEFGGAARAQATMGDKARVAWGNFQEAVGTLLLPAVDSVLGGFTRITNFASNNLGPAVGKVIDRYGPGLRQIADLTWGKLQGGIDALRKLTKLDFSKIDGKKLGEQLGTAIADGLESAGKVVDKITDAIGRVLGKVDWVGLGIEVGRQAPALMLGLATGIINFDFGSLLGGIKDHWGEILIGALAIAFAPAKLVGPLTRIIGKIPFVGRFLAGAVTWVNELGGKLLRFGGDLLGQFWKGFTAGRLPGAQFVGRILGAIRGLPGRLADFWETLKTRIGVWALDAFESAGKSARKAVGKLLGFVGSIPGRILRALGSLLRTLSPRGADLIQGLASGASDRFGRVLSFVKSIPGRILRGLGDLGGLLFGVGKDIVRGLISGVGALKDEVVKALLALIPGPLKKFASKLGIKSPSTVFFGFGVNVVQGFVNGIDAGRRLVASALGRMAKTVAKHGRKITFSGGPGGHRHGGLKQSVLDLVQAAGAAGDLSSALDGLAEAASKAKTRGMAHFIQGVKNVVQRTANLTERVASLKESFNELSASIASAFKPGDLFSGSAGQLFSGLTKWRNNLAAVKSAQATLLNAGLSGDFLQELFQSGNVQLIGQLAANPSRALEYQSLFESASGLAKEVGDAIATQATSADVMAVVDELAKVRQQLADQPDRISRGVADALNSVASSVAQTAKGRRR